MLKMVKHAGQNFTSPCAGIQQGVKATPARSAGVWVRAFGTLRMYCYSTLLKEARILRIHE
jgi:hypothetical protein